MKRGIRIAIALLSLGIFANAPAPRGWAQAQQPPEDRPEMKTPPATSGFLGAKFAIVDDDAAEKLGLTSSGGMIVIEVVKTSPAEQAGLQENDVILKIDGEEVPDRDTFIDKMSTTKPGQAITITVMREKEQKDLDVTLGQRPKNFPASQPTTRPG